MRVRAFLRLAVLGATSVVLLATSVSTCVEHDVAAFDVRSSCGPAGILSVSYSGAKRGCNGGCFGYLEAPGASALGLPDRGEADADFKGPHEPASPGDVLRHTHFALVGPSAIPGALPPLVVERRCRAGHTDLPDVLDLVCEGDVPEAACSGTLTFRPGGP